MDDDRNNDNDSNIIYCYKSNGCGVTKNIYDTNVVVWRVYHHPNYDLP